MVAITTPIELPSESLFVGSNTLPVFNGEIKDMVIINRPLSVEEIAYISKEKKSSLSESGSTLKALEEY